MKLVSQWVLEQKWEQEHRDRKVLWPSSSEHCKARGLGVGCNKCELPEVPTAAKIGRSSTASLGSSAPNHSCRKAVNDLQF